MFQENKVFILDQKYADKFVKYTDGFHFAAKHYCIGRSILN